MLVIPAQAGIQFGNLDSRLLGNDGNPGALSWDNALVCGVFAMSPPVDPVF